MSTVQSKSRTRVNLKSTVIRKVRQERSEQRFDIRCLFCQKEKISSFKTQVLTFLILFQVKKTQLTLHCSQRRGKTRTLPSVAIFICRFWQRSFNTQNPPSPLLIFFFFARPQITERALQHSRLNRVSYSLLWRHGRVNRRLPDNRYEFATLLGFSASFPFLIFPHCSHCWLIIPWSWPLPYCVALTNGFRPENKFRKIKEINVLRL